jgi:hypothetical protein
MRWAALGRTSFASFSLAAIQFRRRRVSGRDEGVALGVGGAVDDLFEIE